MKKEVAVKAKELLEEIDELGMHKEILKDADNRLAHFEFIQHYGKGLTGYEKVVIDKRHNKRFLSLLRTIITELETELDKL